MKRLLLWLWAGWLLASACANPATPPAADGLVPVVREPARQVLEKAPLIVAFGDSLTAGPRVSSRSNYPALLQDLLVEAGYSYRVVNAGISGDTTSQGLTRLQGVIEMRPRMVILELGANDGLRGMPLAASRKNLDRMIRSFKDAGIEVVLAGMRIPPNYGMLYTEEFHRMYSDLAGQYEVTLIPFFLEGVAGDPDLNLDDGIHPNAEGYGRVARIVFENIKPLLQ